MNNAAHQIQPVHNLRHHVDPSHEIESQAVKRSSWAITRRFDIALAIAGLATAVILVILSRL